MIKRLKVCWYVLTKKHFAFFAFDRPSEDNSGVQCYIENDTLKYEFFLEAISDYTKDLADLCKKR